MSNTSHVVNNFPIQAQHFVLSLFEELTTKGGSVMHWNDLIETAAAAGSVAIGRQVDSPESQVSVQVIASFPQSSWLKEWENRHVSREFQTPEFVNIAYMVVKRLRSKTAPISVAA